MALPTLKQTITEDRFWGFVLIALGIASVVFKPFDKLDTKLKGSSDAALTGILIVMGFGIICLGFFASPGTKAFAVFWVVAP